MYLLVWIDNVYSMFFFEPCFDSEEEGVIIESVIIFRMRAMQRKLISQIQLLPGSAGQRYTGVSSAVKY